MELPTREHNLEYRGDETTRTPMPPLMGSRELILPIFFLLTLKANQTTPHVCFS